MKGWHTATSIPWLENASLGCVSSLPLSRAERITLKDGSASLVITNAQVYLAWLQFMAPRVNTYIDKHHIKGAGARRHYYILNRFLRHCRHFADFSLLRDDHLLTQTYKRVVNLIGAP